MSNPESAKHIQALKNEARSVRLSAVETLGKSGDASVVPALIKTLKDRDDEVRSASTEALVHLGAPAVRPLGKMLAGEDGNACRSITTTLVRIGIPAVPVLVEALRHDEALHYAINALREMGEAASLPRRVLFCRELSPQQRIDALNAMRQMGRKRREFRVWNTLPDVQPFCTQILEEDDEDVREEARVVLNWLKGGNQLLRASQRDTTAESQELLRGASATGSATAPDELLRAGDAPEAETTLPAPEEPKRRGLLARFRRTDA